MRPRSVYCDRLMDRRWRTAHPFRPRVTAHRRTIMMVLFVLFTSIIGAYLFVTDSNRVKRIAETYLSQVLGGPVEVRRANLSIFEGLQLEGVTVHVDRVYGEDSIVFSAESFKIDYNAQSMLRGKLQASHILAIKPHVRLTQNVRTGVWNYQRMAPEQKTSTQPAQASPTVLPEIILRDAQVENGEIRDGVYHPLGTISVEGRLHPGTHPGLYSFNLQSRTAANDRPGPELNGWVIPRSGEFSLSLRDFTFGAEIQSMLPKEVRHWWEQHQLAGVLNVPQILYAPGRDGAKPTFTVQMVVDGVTLVVHPPEWRSRVQNAAIESIRNAVQMPLALNPASTLGHIYRYTVDTPVRLERVKGRFLFTEKGIDIKDCTGTIEDNEISVSGHYDDYTPDAPAMIQIASSRTVPFQIPHAPAYINSMPAEIRNIYNAFKPEGTGRLDFKLNRPTAGARVQVTGGIEIISGSFVFDRFAYPLREATGKILLTQDDATNEGFIEIVNLRGRGAAGGPNADGHVTINSRIGPLGPDMGFQIKVEANDIYSEPALIAAMPRETREALKMFDAPGQGEYPRFNGDFVCNVLRPVGPDQKWDIATDISIKNATGRLVAFPYPMDGVTAHLKIREGYLDIVDAKMNRGDSSLLISGRVAWGDDTGHPGKREKHMRPDLTVTARKVPIDPELINALPPARRKWVESAALGGFVDIDGRVFLDERSQVGLDLKIGLKDGMLWKQGDSYAATQLSGNARLLPNQLVLSEVKARRGDADLSAHGTISWFNEKAAVSIDAAAVNLTLDKQLYAALPAVAKAGWDQVHPQGVVNAALTYRDKPAEPSVLASVDTSPLLDPKAVVPPLGDEKLKLVIRPVKLSILPEVVPYRLDNVQGSATIMSSRVTLENLTADHGDGKVWISGTGALTEPAVWDLKLRAEKLEANAELIKALPPSLASFVDSMKVGGHIGIDFSKLVYRSATASIAPTSAASQVAATRPAPSGDLDFVTRVTMENAALSAGVPLSEVQGTLDLSGAVRTGNLVQLAGGFDVDSMKLAGRSASSFTGKIRTEPADDLRIITEMNGQLAHGSFVGNVDLTMPQVGASSYELGLVLRNADVRDLAGERESEISGHLSASLSLEGNWSDPASRRGRGDVLVAGKKMYRIPVVLGLLEIANLSLPLSSPFNEATSSYSVQGSAITFETIELKSPGMTMTGNGSLNFDTKKVKMTFTTDNPSWPKIPFVDQILQGARKELFQIRVNGTVEEPKVSAGTLNTVSTTIDEVFNGGK